MGLTLLDHCDVLRDPHLCELLGSVEGGRRADDASAQNDNVKR